MMSTVATRRVLLLSKKVQGLPVLKLSSPHVRCVSSSPASNKGKDGSEKFQLQRREIHKTIPSRADAQSPMLEVEEKKESSVQSGGMIQRFIVTGEVTVSKIFPAGFGWQTSSIIAENNLGYAPDTMAFALTTGGGDALGVLGGHVAYYGLKRALVDSSINMARESQIGILLASAAFCSGTAWQPVVDALQGANVPFSAVFAGTWVACGSAFYIGLRAGRTILSGFLEHIHEPTYENSKTDTSLSVAIGGATGFFVGTDAAYLPDQNFLLDVVGIPDGTPDLTGCVIAGTSTGLGFVSAQTGLNFVFPAGKCWND